MNTFLNFVPSWPSTNTMLILMVIIGLMIALIGTYACTKILRRLKQDSLLPKENN